MILTSDALIFEVQLSIILAVKMYGKRYLFSAKRVKKMLCSGIDTNGLLRNKCTCSSNLQGMSFLVSFGLLYLDRAMSSLD